MCMSHLQVWRMQFDGWIGFACLIAFFACSLARRFDLHVWFAFFACGLARRLDLHFGCACRPGWISCASLATVLHDLFALWNHYSSESFFRVIVSLLWHLPIVRLLWTKVMPRSFRNKYYNILYNSYNIAAFAANHWLLCQVGKTKVPTTKPAPEEIAGCKRSPKKRT